MEIKGDINVYRRYKVISAILLVGIVVFFLSLAVSKRASIYVVLTAVILIVTCLLRIKENEKTVVFHEHFILFYRKGIESKIDYTNVEKIIFSNPVRYQKSIKLIFKNRCKVTFRLTSGQSDQEVFEFIRLKNENIKTNYRS